MKTKRFYKNKCQELEKELEAKSAYIEDLKGVIKRSDKLDEILEKLVDEQKESSKLEHVFNIDGTSILPNDVAFYVCDMFGGRVIKQEAIKGIRIDKEGNVETGLTAQSPDKGYSYKLVRE